MPRRSAAQIRPIEPDARHRNRLVQQLINKVMSHGKKSLAERIVYDSLAIIGERSGEDPIEVLESAVKQLTPVLEVRSREVPFILEHGQIVGRLAYEKMIARPDTLYGQGIGSNYQAQGLKLSKHFKV